MDAKDFTDHIDDLTELIRLDQKHITVAMPLMLISRLLFDLTLVLKSIVNREIK